MQVRCGWVGVIRTYRNKEFFGKTFYSVLEWAGKKYTNKIKFIRDEV